MPEQRAGCGQVRGTGLEEPSQWTWRAWSQRDYRQGSEAGGVEREGTKRRTLNEDEHDAAVPLVLTQGAPLLALAAMPFAGRQAVGVVKRGKLTPYWG